VVSKTLKVFPHIGNEPCFIEQDRPLCSRRCTVKVTREGEGLARRPHTVVGELQVHITNCTVNSYTVENGIASEIQQIRLLLGILAINEIL
jgi:hypothetical protein